MYQTEQELVDYETLVRLLGAPPLLAGEDQSFFKQYFESLCRTLRPLDFNMQRLVYEYELETTSEMRLRRFSSLLMREASNVPNMASPSGDKELMAAKEFEKSMRPYASFSMLIDQHSKRAAMILREIEWCREAAVARSRRMADMEDQQWRREEMQRVKQIQSKVTEES